MDYLYYNTQIYTLDPDRPRAEAVAVRDGRVLAVGQLTELWRMGGADRAEAIDLRGATLLPGFNDAHTHFVWWALSLQKINLVGVDSLEEVVRRVRERAEQTPPGQWLTGLGWDKNLWGVEFPTGAALDRAAPDHPVALSSKDSHMLWVNSRALERCGIGPDTADPPGGEIMRDAQGRPTGVFKENAMALINRYLEVGSLETNLTALRQALPLAYRAGLTGVHTIEDNYGLAAFQRLRETEGLWFRATVLPYSSAAPALIELGFRQGFGDEMLRLGQVKFFLDGTLGSQTAAMFEPFLETVDHSHGENEADGCEAANTGILRMEPEEFEQQAQRCLANGFAVAVHVIGDRAAHLGLDVIEKAVAGHRELNLPPGARNRLEHVQLLKAADLPRLARNGIVASVQPTHATTDCDTAERYWGLPRMTESGRGYAYKSMLQSGAHLALGSDVPIEPIEPLLGIYAAVARRRPDDDRPAWLPHERLSVLEAVQGFTQGVAYAGGDEQWRGTIRPGFAADFTALGQDIFEAPVSEIPVTPVVATVVAGRPQFFKL